jgi:hypothetical protein
VDVGLPVAGLLVEVEGKTVGALDLTEADLANAAGAVAPDHNAAVALGAQSVGWAFGEVRKMVLDLRKKEKKKKSKYN